MIKALLWAIGPGLICTWAGIVHSNWFGIIWGLLYVGVGILVLVVKVKKQ